MQAGNRHQHPSYSQLHLKPLDIACAISACTLSSCKLAHFLPFLRWFILPRACWADSYSRLASFSPCSNQLVTCFNGKHTTLQLISPIAEHDCRSTHAQLLQRRVPSITSFHAHQPCKIIPNTPPWAIKSQEKK